MRNSKIFFDGVFLSIYAHLLKKLELSKKKLWSSKIPKMACSKLVKNSKNNLSIFFPFLKFIQERDLIIKKNPFYVTFLGQSVLKL